MLMRASLLFLLLAEPISALAGGPPMTQDELKALKTYCKADVERICPTVEPGGGRIKACLMAHKEQISVGCAEALQKVAKPK